MEQVYSYTQDKPSYHARGITNSELKNKAQTLSEEADKIVQDSGLSALKAPATTLRDAAKQDSGGQDDLYNDAGQLASQDNSGLVVKAETVIQRFEAVERAYGALMEAANEDQKKNPLVTAVDKEYNDLKNIYDQMLNLTKLLNKADALQKAASNAPLSGPASTLVTSVKTLRDNSGNDYTNAQTVIQEFEKVETAYSNLDEKKKQDVKTKFEVLKNLYDKIFKFTKVKYYSEKLASAAQNLSTSSDPENVIEKFNAVVTVFDALDPYSQSQVQAQFDGLQTEYSKAIYAYKCQLLTLLSS